MSIQHVLRTGALGLLASLAVGLAQAGDVYWSVGVNTPGVSVGVGNRGLVMVSPQVVYQPPVVQYYPVVPVYGVAYAPVPVQPRWGRHHHHHRGRDDWRDERGYSNRGDYRYGDRWD